MLACANPGRHLAEDVSLAGSQLPLTASAMARALVEELRAPVRQGETGVESPADRTLTPGDPGKHARDTQEKAGPHRLGEPNLSKTAPQFPSRPARGHPRPPRCCLGVMRNLVPLLVAACVGCGSDAPSPDAGLCARHADCDDAVFCNGPELCQPDDPTADPRGCTLAVAPCSGE